MVLIFKIIIKTVLVLIPYINRIKLDFEFDFFFKNPIPILKMRSNIVPILDNIVWN
jgi:hypothetical protein